jgi:hypothetical protein
VIRSGSGEYLSPLFPVRITSFIRENSVGLQHTSFESDGGQEAPNGSFEDKILVMLTRCTMKGKIARG